MKTRLKFIIMAFFVLATAPLVLIMTNGTTVMNECEVKESHDSNRPQCSRVQDEFRYESIQLRFNIEFLEAQTEKTRIGFVANDKDTQRAFSVLQVDLSEPIDGTQNALVRVGQNKQPFIWQMNIAIPNTKIQEMRIQLDEGRRIRIWTNDELVYGSRWDVSLTQPFPPSSAEILIDGDPKSLQARMFIKQETSANWTFLTNTVQIAVLVLGLLLAFALGGNLKLKRIGSTSKAFNSYVSSSIIWATLTSITVLVSLMNFFGEHSYFDRNGITYARIARFSDWHQLYEIARYGEPYLVGSAQYPPAFLGMFKAIPFVANEYGLVFFCIICPLSIGYLMMKVFENRSFLAFCILVISVCISYPYLFAVDRGSSELMMVTVFVLFVMKLIKGQLFLAAIALGILIGLKVFPIIFLPILVRRRKDWINPMISLATATALTIIGSFVLSGNAIKSLVQFLSQATESDNAINQATSSSERSTSLFQWMHGLIEAGPSDLASSEVPFLLQHLVPLLGLMIFFLVSFFFIKSHLSLANQLMLLTISMLILVPLSYDYRLLWLLPVFVIWLNSEKNSKFRLPLIVAFGVLFSARPIYFLTDRLTIGSMMTFPLLLTILIAILYENLGNQKVPMEKKLDKAP